MSYIDSMMQDALRAFALDLRIRPSDPSSATQSEIDHCEALTKMLRHKFATITMGEARQLFDQFTHNLVNYQQKIPPEEHTREV